MAIGNPTDIPKTRRFTKAVQVEVTVTDADIMRGMTDDEIRQTCRARGIKLKEPKRFDESKPPRVKIDKAALDDAYATLLRGDIPEALHILESVLPRELNNISEVIENHYRGRQ